jgi:hypothetical protein
MERREAMWTDRKVHAAPRKRGRLTVRLAALHSLRPGRRKKEDTGVPRAAKNRGDDACLPESS